MPLQDPEQDQPDIPASRADSITLSAANPVPPMSALTTTEEENEEHINTKDFGFIPIPKRLWHDPKKPHEWTLALNIVFGISSTFIVANLYYCQPLLIQLSESFNVTFDEVSRIPTLVQAGYAVGLLFISPLGDLVPRRQLILLLAIGTSSLSIGLPLTQSVVTFEVLEFLIGILTVVPQILMPLAADLAPPHRRASALSIVLSGLLLGVLIARVLAGVVAQFVSWRIVYWIAVGVQWAVVVMIWAMIPDYPRRNTGLTYPKIFITMAKFLVTEPVVVQAVFINMASTATFTNFWVTLTFLLGGPPYHYSTLGIGLFGLIGIGGVCCAPLTGRLVDRLHPFYSVLISTLLLIAVWVLETGAGGITVAVVIITCFGVDIFRQMQQVSLTNWVFGLEQDARARLNALLLLSLFIGQVMGTSAGSKVFVDHGWRPAAALALGFEVFCLIVLFMRGPNARRYTWFGWEGGWKARKEDLNLTGRSAEAEDVERGSQPTGEDAKSVQDGKKSTEKRVSREEKQESSELAAEDEKVRSEKADPERTES
ncbi:hypothetical protein QCA50_004092 [Cerrena zonata]|uniref:Major facilitator superfamily (MFS) profile domain-containing protein n=1 Tax=Cerrena zonata TaxID=2478898 RepID=A0AAW0GIG5_9APHY